MGAITTDGQLFIWGYNGHGCLGDGTTTERHSPERIDPAHTWATLSVGDLDTAAITTDGHLFAWGYNAFGTLGDGTTTDHPTPEQVGTAGDWRERGRLELRDRRRAPRSLTADLDVSASVDRHGRRCRNVGSRWNVRRGRAPGWDPATGSGASPGCTSVATAGSRGKNTSTMAAASDGHDRADHERGAHGVGVGARRLRGQPRAGRVPAGAWATPSASPTELLTAEPSAAGSRCTVACIVDW